MHRKKWTASLLATAFVLCHTHLALSQKRELPSQATISALYEQVQGVSPTASVLASLTGPAEGEQHP